MMLRRIFGPRRDEVTGEWRRLHNEELNDRGGTVVKVLHYKSEGRWLDPSWCHWNFSST